MSLRLDLEDKDFRKTKKFTWLSSNSESIIRDAKIVEFDHLINKEKVEENDDFDALVNRDSIVETRIFASSAVNQLNPGDCLQFLRKGNYRMDASGVFFYIPDGSSKN
jgi:glutamyl-tRNA synthetase|mmetsp:Transcript_14640/g.2406  ORF Transcript_14640/g.2406 Transcript_14640/m.2406 type:complete len:108 (+) Transcript_14640:774-1097(+)